LTILATGLGWEVGRGRGREGEGGVSWSPPLCEILITPLGMAIPIADERVGVQVKLISLENTCHT